MLPLTTRPRTAIEAGVADNAARPGLNDDFPAPRHERDQQSRLAADNAELPAVRAMLDRLAEAAESPQLARCRDGRPPMTAAGDHGLAERERLGCSEWRPARFYTVGNAPPSIVNWVPVRYEAEGEIKNRISCAASSGVPARPSGICND